MWSKEQLHFIQSHLFVQMHSKYIQIQYHKTKPKPSIFHKIIHFGNNPSKLTLQNPISASGPRRGESGWRRGRWFTVCVDRGTLTHFWQVMQHLANGALLKKKKKSKINTPLHASVQCCSLVCALHMHPTHMPFSCYTELTPCSKKQSEDKTAFSHTAE